MNIRYTEISCGIFQIDHIFNDSAQAMSYLVSSWKERSCPAIYIWSHVDMPAYGKTSGHKFADFIKEHELGDVEQGLSVTNPNTGNTITMWAWYVNRQAVANWYNNVQRILKNTSKNQEVAKT